MLFRHEAKIYPYPYPVNFKQTAYNQGFELLLSLNGYWRSSEGLVYPVPFVSDQHSYLELNYDVVLPGQVPDTVFFYTEGLGPSFSIYLDDKLLYYSQHSRMAIWLPIPQKILQNKTTLRIILQKEISSKQHWFGLYQPVYLLKRSTPPDSVAVSQSLSFLPRSTATDSVILFSTINSSYGLYPDTLWLRNHLSNLKQAGYNSVFFTDPVDNFLWPIIAEIGINVVLEVPQKAKVAYLFYYQDSLHSWLNAKGQKTIYWGKFLHQSSYNTIEPKQQSSSPKKEMYIALLAIFLVIITSLRLYSARVFMTLHSILAGPKELYNQLLYAQKLRSSKIVFFSIAKIPLTAIGLWLIQAQFSTRFGLLVWSYSAELLWGALLAGYAAYYGFKFAMIFFFANVYHRRNLGQMGVGLDLAAGFVTWELMLLAALLSYIVAEKVQNLLIFAWAGLLIVHIIRRIYLINTILANYFQLGYLVRTLYLCTLEILPWLLLFTIR